MKSMRFCIVLLLILLVGCGKPSTDDLVKSSATVSHNSEEAHEEVQQSNETTDTDALDETNKPKKVDFSRLENLFAFADEFGEQLITLPNGSEADVINPGEFNTAIGNNGERIEIEFVSRQEANEQDTNNQTVSNFPNMSGYIYRVKSGSLQQYESYLLTREGVIDENSLVDLKSTINDQSQFKEYLPVDTETVTLIESIKKRKVTTSSLLSASNEEKIALFVFEREGDDMLASIAYIKGDLVLFKDYPAKYNVSGTWRVDAGDEPGWFEVLFLAHSENGILLGLSWASSESQNLFVLKEANGSLQETNLESSRYLIL